MKHVANSTEDSTAAQNEPYQRMIEQPTSECGSQGQKMTPPLSPFTPHPQPGDNNHHSYYTIYNHTNRMQGIMCCNNCNNWAATSTSKEDATTQSNIFTININHHRNTQLKSHSFFDNHTYISGSSQCLDSKGVGHIRRNMDTKRHIGAQFHRMSYNR